METIRNRIIKNELVDIEKLTPFQGKLKTLDDKNFNKLRKSIVEEGFSFTVHVWQNDKTIYIIDGHQRVSVLTQMRKQGIKVPPISCAFVSAETYRDAKKLVLLAISQYGKIQKDGFLEFVDGEDFDFGDYDFPDITFDISSLFEKPKEEFDESKEDDIPEKAPARVQTGEIWQLGDHRLMCGDSTSNDCVSKLIADNVKLDICFTSPPYNAGSFGYDGGKSKYKKENDDNRTSEEYLDFLKKFTDIALNTCQYVFFNNQFLSGNRRSLALFFGYYADSVKDVFPWIKSTAPPNVNKGVFTNRFEFFLCLEKDCRKKGFPVDWQGKFHNVIEGATAASDNVAKGQHAATMPIYVPSWFLERLDFIKTIYEPFCGSGTTIIASEKFGKKCFAMEMDPSYCDIIIERWENLTGKTAERVSDGG
jgi:site-specific DNA-methyltransferase (adenine-specific)